MSEKVIKMLKGYCEWCKAQGGDCQAHLDGCTISDALAELTSKPAPPKFRGMKWKCSNCGYLTDQDVGTCKGYCQDSTGKSCDAKPCPRCGKYHYWTSSFELPQPTEFAKECRELIKAPDDEKGWSELAGYTIWLEVKLQRACDIIDHQAAENEKLKDMLKVHREVGIGQAIEIKRLKGQIKAYESKPASVECPKCKTIIKTV